MRKYILSEGTEGDLLMQTTIAKALSQAPLTLSELRVLQETDFGQLIGDHDLDFNSAEKVLAWGRNEQLRMNAQSQYVSIEDFQAHGCRPGTRQVGLLESLGRRTLRQLERCIVNEIRAIKRR